MKICDHTSVGILVWRNNKLLLISRKKHPLGLAPPAGHVDNRPSFEAAARAELSEETGLKATKLIEIASEKKNNPCRRSGGAWHFWRVYVAATSGTLTPSQHETLGAGWYTESEIRHMIEFGIFDGAPLEAVWQDWFREIDVLRFFSRP